MPSNEFARGLLRAMLLLCVCTQGAAAAVDSPDPTTNNRGCFPGFDRVERGEAVGDVVELEMLLCFRGVVTVSGPGYEANISIDKGNWSGSATVTVDTWRNGSEAIRVSTSHERAAQINATGNGSFQPGNYTVTLSYWDGDTADTVNFTLGRPRASDVTVFGAPKGAASKLQSAAAVRQARAVSPADSARRFDDPDMDAHLSLAANETLVVAVRGDGLEGAMAAGGDTPLARFRAALRAAGGSLTLRQTAETVTPQRQPLTPDLLNSSATHLVPDADNDTYYLVVDTRRLWGEWEGGHGGPVNVGSRAGTGYAVRFSMQNGTDAVPADLVAADFVVVEAAIAGPASDEEPVALRPEQNASLPLRTTLAAGTPVTVTVAGLPDGPLERNVRVQRVENGAVVALDLDLSGVPNGTSLSVTVERDGQALDNEVNAVVSTVPKTTETPTPTPPTATETDTASPTPPTSTRAPDSPTPRPVPGFSALHGAAALLLAVLALRRAQD